MYDICLTVSAWCIIGLLGVLFISSARREISRRALLCCMLLDPERFA